MRIVCDQIWNSLLVWGLFRLIPRTVGYTVDILYCITHMQLYVHSTVSRISWTNLSVINYAIFGHMLIQQCHGSQNLVNYAGQNDDRAESPAQLLHRHHRELCTGKLM